MSCEQYRDAISARLDGEDPGLPDASLDAHLAACPDCASWAAAARRVTRLVRVGPAEPVPDLTAAVLAAAGPPRRRLRPGELLVRAGLGLVALGQLLLSWPSLLGQDSMAQTMHGAHESGAWNAALAVALGWVAVRPRHAAGLVPLLAALLAGLVGVSLPDLVHGYVDPGRLSTHLLVGCGLGLVATLAWVRRDPRPSRGGRGGGIRPAHPAGGADGGQPAATGPPRGFRLPRPASGGQHETAA